jgi:hypothetical protein
LYGAFDKGETWEKERDRPSYRKMMGWAQQDRMSQIANRLILRHLNCKNGSVPYPTYQDVVAEYEREGADRFARAHPSLARAVGA